jgi:hypothetical protein
MKNLIARFLIVLAGATAQAEDVPVKSPRPNDRQPTLEFNNQQHQESRTK